MDSFALTLLVAVTLIWGTLYLYQSGFLTTYLQQILTTTTIKQTSSVSTTLYPTTTIATTTFTTSLSTTSLSTTTLTTTSITSTVPTTTIYTTSTSTPTTTTSTTTTIPHGNQEVCQVDDYLEPNQSMSCSDVSLTLVAIVIGSERYEIANALVNISLNGVVQFDNLSLAQNLTSPYQLNFTNGQSLKVYVYDANYNQYPVYQYANISMTYYK